MFIAKLMTKAGNVLYDVSTRRQGGMLVELHADMACKFPNGRASIVSFAVAFGSLNTGIPA